LSIPLGHDQWKIGTAFHTGYFICWIL
jgi:hypothetical protein